jgi:glycosyltransferase involved in cell wall biosynthesis
VNTESSLRSFDQADFVPKDISDNVGDRRRISLLIPVNQLGYGIAGLNILANLASEDEVALFPIGNHIDPQDVPAPMRGVVDLALVRAGFYDDRAPSLRVWHQTALGEHVGRGARIGFPFFELTRLKAAEKHHMGAVDRLVVASRWAADICEANGLARPEVVPLGVDRGIFHEGVPYDRLDPDYTVFINVGKWEVRKGHDVLLKCFNQAFEPTDKVVLKMLTLNPFLGQGNERWARDYMATKMGVAGRIVLEPRRFRSQREVASFIASADVGVFPARAEAWNLDLLECMSCGLHCIATDYSGHTEYADSGNCSLIRVGGLEQAYDGVWFSGEGAWASFGGGEEDQLVAHLRAYHRLKQTGGLPRRNVAAIETATRFGWDGTAGKLRRILS